MVVKRWLCIVVFVLVCFIISSFIVQSHLSQNIEACSQLREEIEWDGERVSNPVVSGYVSSDFNTVDQAHDMPHNGSDIAATGHAFAVVSGIVVANTYNPARGYLVAIGFRNKEGKAFTYMYQHLAKQSDLRIGMYVKSGDVIGVIGNSGHSFGVHLHAEVEYADVRGDQLRWRGTFPTNPERMFDFIRFFHLPRQFSGKNHNQINKTSTLQRCYATPSSLKGSNEEKAWAFFRNQGFTEEGAAGVIGNLIVESGLNPLSGEIGSASGGRGIAQWGQCGVASNGANTGCRWKELEKWAKGNKQNPDELLTQLKYVIKEMTDHKSIEYFRKVKILYIQSGRYGGGAVGYFAESFERPDVRYAHMDTRYQQAKRILSTLGNK